MTKSVVVRPDSGEPAFVIGKEILKHLGLNADSVQAKALVLVCRRYGLDPLLNEASIVKNKPYITRDGMIKIAHRSGQLDGIVIEEERASDHGWSATVSVWRKDMTHPFTYKGGCGRTESQAVEGHGAEMALARAERRALRRAFAIPAYDDVDDPVIDEDLTARHSGETPGPADGGTPLPVSSGRAGTTSSGDHTLQTARTAQDPFTCSCGEIFPTIWAFRMHRTAMLEDPPAEVYDSAPESRGDIDDLQPTSYDDPDPGRPFTDEPA